MKKILKLFILCLSGIFLASCDPYSSNAEPLGEGYSRAGDLILFRGKRIDRNGVGSLKSLASDLRRPITLCSNVDAASFTVLSQQYTKDKDKVYYKWIRGGQFWVIEIPGADPESFEALGFWLARDKNHVWRQDSIVKGADPTNAKCLFGYRVWMDANHVWSGNQKVPEADRDTLERMTESGFGYYRDRHRVYSYYGRLKVLEGAEPKTFKITGPGDRYAEDRNFRWDNAERLPKN